MKKIFCIITICLSVTALADYYIYVCSVPLCGFSTIKRNPGSMNCPTCARKYGEFKYLFGEKIEQK